MDEWSTSRAFVDTPPRDVPASTLAAEHAAAQLGLAPPELLRVGMNAIFVAGDVVLRVGHTNAPAGLALELAAVLRGAGIRVPAPAAAGPVEVGPWSVTAWERLAASGDPVDWVAVGAMVRRLHRLDPSELPDGLPLPSPAAFPWWDFEAVLDDVGDLLDVEAGRAIASAIERHRSWRSQVGVDAVVCHGDVHPGNVVQVADGPVLLDWDLLCRAPWGWDHALLLTWASRWGGDPAVLTAFEAGYGRSAADEPFAVAVAELRLVAATLLRLRAGRDDPAARAEAERRLRWWRGDRDAPPWRVQ